jgi:hypothetical protein
LARDEKQRKTMGNACCGGKEESSKVSALTEVGDDVADRNFLQQSTAATNFTSSDNNNAALHIDGVPQQRQAISDAAFNHQNATMSLAEQKSAEQAAQILRRELARAKAIVQETGRAMVSVRSTRGSTVYYDQGFAAALSQHLEQATQFPDHVPALLPPAPEVTSLLHPAAATSKSDGAAARSSVYALLSQSEWEGVAIGTKDGLAGCAGENPVKYLDHIAEQFLDSVIPKKERIFTKAPLIMENLL